MYDKEKINFALNKLKNNFSGRENNVLEIWNMDFMDRILFLDFSLTPERNTVEIRAKEKLSQILH